MAFSGDFAAGQQDGAVRELDSTDIMRWDADGWSCDASVVSRVEQLRCAGGAIHGRGPAADEEYAAVRQEGCGVRHTGGGQGLSERREELRFWVEDL